jgi:hypothetical protein
MFNLRADLAATQLAMDAVVATLPPEAHAQLLSAWRTMRAAYEAAASRSSQAPQSRTAIERAMQTMDQRLLGAPGALRELRKH